MKAIHQLLLLCLPFIIFYTTINSQTINVPSDYTTIQQAINAANNGDIISIEAGTYNETITLNKVVEINGAGINTTIINGSVLINAFNDAGRITLKDVSIITNNSPYMVETRYAIFINGSGGNTAPVTIENVEARMNNPVIPTVYGAGLLISPDGNTINDVVVSNSIFNNNYTHGIYIKNNLVNTGGIVSNLTIENSSFNDNDTKGGTSFYGYGLYILAPNVSPTLIVDGLSVTNSTFNGHYRIGLYIESLSNAIFSNVTASGNGEEGININLKYGDYSDISFNGCTFINNSANGVIKPDIHIKGRDDGTYSGNPASLQNISITSSEFGGVSFGNNITGVPTVYGNYIRSRVINYKNSGSVNCSGNWWGSRDPTVISTMLSGAVIYSPWWGNNYLNDSHTTGWNWITNSNLQSTINHSSIHNGDNISLTPGEYTESFVINKSLTFGSLDASNKAVIKGVGTRTFIASSWVLLKDLIYDLSGNTTTDGVIVIDRGGAWPNYTIQYSNITFSGIEVYGGRRALYATVENITIENSIFESQFRDALFFNAVAGNTLIRDNYFYGADANKAILFENFSSADPAVSGSILIERNTVNGKRNFTVYNQWLHYNIPIDIKINDNHIAPYGTAISVYDPREFIPSFESINFSKINSIEIRKNRFTLNSVQVGIEGPVEIKNRIDARRNWWGNSDGPAANAVSNGINPIPWCFDEDCTRFSAINVSSGDSISTAIGKAEDGDTITVDMPEITEVFTIDRNVTLKFSEPPVIDSFKVNNANLTVASEIIIKYGLDLYNGNIITTENEKIIFDSTAVPPVETPTAKIIGIVEVKPREVGSGAVQLLGLEIEPGEDNLGKVSLIRKSGNKGIVTVAGNSGLSMTWDISVDNQPENGRVVKFTWLPDFDNGVVPSSVIVYRNTGTGWEYYAGPFNADGNPRQVIINTTGFSSWTIGSSDAPLPVELISFEAKVVNNNIHLVWNTVTESANYGFEVERFVKLLDDDWQKIGFVQGNGNSYSPKEYLFVDENPPAGVINYRLKQIDFDGTFEYYQNIAEVNYNLSGIDEMYDEIPNEYKLYQNYPNPFNPVTVIKYAVPGTVGNSIAVQNILLKVYDLLGREVAELVNEPKLPGIYETKFDASKLPSGVYIYSINAGNFNTVRKMMLIK